MVGGIGEREPTLGSAGVGAVKPDVSAEDLSVAPEATSEVSAEHVRRLAAVLDVDLAVTNGTHLPLLWHWAFFTPVLPKETLGVDGHPRPASGVLCPQTPRRMWAGGRVSLRGPVLAGVPATRRTSVARLQRKNGRSGSFVLVTLSHEITQNDELVLVEDQDLVYRCSADGKAPVVPSPAAQPATPDAGWCDTVTLDPVDLFRFSAVTFNSHRIHYDHSYATRFEGYPGLLVHGPLTALLLLGAAERRGHVGTSFSFRAVAPLYVGMEFCLLGRPTGDGVDLQAVRRDGATAMSAHLS